MSNFDVSGKLAVVTGAAGGIGMAVCRQLGGAGATIAMGRVLGYTRESALRYSFLLAVPAVFGSGFYELTTAIGENDPSAPYSLIETFGATIVAFVVGYAVIAWLMKFISTKSFMPFYRTKFF